MKKKYYKWSHLAAHSTYLGFAAAEGHGLYSLAAGALLAIVWAGVFIGEEILE